MPTPQFDVLLIEILDLHARGLLRMPWIQSLIVLGIGLFIVPSIDLFDFVLWASAAVAAEACRARYARRILKCRLKFNPHRAHLVFIGLAALTGGIISAGAVLFFPKLSVVNQALLGATLFALPAAGAAVSSSRWILSAYAVCVLLPASVTWALLHPNQGWGLAALTTAYCVTIFFVSADGEKLVLRSVKIRHERDQLIRDLERRNHEVLAAVEKAEQSAQARARVLAAASHDLRQPLHALSLYSAVLAANPTPGTVLELSQSIDLIVRSLGSLLNGLLDLSRLSAAHYIPETQVLDLENLITQVCEEYQHASSLKGLSLTRNLIHVRMNSDPVAIGRIMRNLLDNAIKYTDAGNVHVATSVERDGEELFARVTVADTGRGIAQSDHDKVFEEFYQIDNPGRNQDKGVGLGLAIVRRLCELNGGSVGIESSPGLGTTFDVRLPVGAIAEVETIASARAAPMLSNFERRCVYVVDDENEILRGMGQLLGAWKLSVFTADTTAAADGLFKTRGKPDLMIVDLRLNDHENGIQLARRLVRQYGAFQVLVVTGETASDVLLEAKQTGFPLLQKPIASEVLHANLVALLTNRQSAPQTPISSADQDCREGRGLLSSEAPRSPAQSVSSRSEANSILSARSPL